MIQKYPVGIQDFGEIRTNGYLYVDKTAFVYKLINEGKFYFLSRPRRFGKSLFISTLECLFLAKKELFKGLYIEDKWNWEQTNPIIRMSFSNIGHKEKGLNKAISDELDSIANKYDIQLSEEIISGKFKELIQKLSATRGKVVVLIDEYDKPIIDYLGENPDKAIENRDIMKVFYSILKDADPHLKLVFITGVSKFSRVSIFSDLNNLQDLTTNKFFAGCCGITQNELEAHFKQELLETDKEAIKKWYNGYSWDAKTSVYNPFSLLSFFVQGSEFKNYWFETGTPTFLIKLAEKTQLYDFSEIEIGANALVAYDIQKLELIPLMFQTGYLTIKSYSPMSDVYVLGYPNNEVKKSYIEVLMAAYSQSDLGYGVVYVDKIRQLLEKGEIERLEGILNTIFKSLPYELWQKENEHFYHAIIHLTFSLLGVYIQSEVQTSDGRMDALIRLKDFVYSIEFKLDESAEKAIQQIKDKGYLVPFSAENKKLVAIGINFSREKKKVEEVKWEEIKA
ncbi:ATP-binding protein [Arcicella rigui]|uniref:AAA family ATPase n=1 Tax=Arcicella rigui TaxID=797020 RepID=A0ABU5QFX8_9BACT|nr:AAA family ATPase [Arcicella rigui]MEA5141447.1 AAA family ATPase [Arcicella rigui]